MKKILIIVLLFIFANIGITSELLRDAVIIASPEWTIPERQAASDLQTYLKKITGGEIPFVKTGNAPRIYIGNTKTVHKLLPDVKFDKLRPDEIIIQRVGGDLILTGTRPRGSILAVYTFLEDMVGVRWWTSTDCEIPKLPDFTLKNWSRRYAPQFIIRHIRYSDIVDNPLFAVQLRLNGQYNKGPKNYGGNIRGLGGAHTFWNLMRAEKYFKSHPEYYALIKGKRRVGEKNGKKKKILTELCMTNEEMRKELVKNAAKWLRDHPDNRRISISQSDYNGYCECVSCRAFVKKHGVPSDLVIDLVNYVSDELKKEFPDVIVDTLAYEYSRPAPKTIKPRKNIIIRLSSINSNFAHPLSSPANRKRFGSSMDGWSKIATQLAVWNYVANYAQPMYPLPNIRSLGKDLRYFAKNKVMWVYEEGAYWVGKAGELVELRAWLLAHLLWNPQLNQDKLIDEFLNGFYGSAAPYIRKYIDLLHDEMAKFPKIDLNCWRRNPHEDWLSVKKILEARDFMLKAQGAVASNPKLLKRVKRASLAINFLLLARPEHSEVSKLMESDKVPDLDYNAILEESVALAVKSGYKSLRKRSNGEVVGKLKRNIAKPDKLPEFCKNLPRQNYVIISNKDFKLTKLGSQVFAKKDPQASSGNSWRMPTNHKNWSVAYKFPAVKSKARWLPYAAVRCDANGTPAENALQFGYYSKPASGHINIPAKKIAGKKFQYIPLCPIVPSKGMSIYLAPIKGNPSVRQVYIDNIVLIKQE